MLERAVGDRDPAIRYIALRVAEEALAEATSGCTWESSALDLARRALQDPHANVKIAAALLLSHRGVHDGASVISSVIDGTMKAEDPQDEAACVEMAGALGCGRVHPHSNDERSGQRACSASAFRSSHESSLAKLGHPRARAGILDDLGAWSLERRTLAVIAAGRVPIEE
ncbi:MAG: hypothetical protein U0165_09905 [Polyangiaceae bacterium]